jgi:hypothetical protein
VKLVISDAHEGIKAAVARVFRATWQRCRVHFMRNALAHAGRSGRRVVAAFIATAFAQDHADAAKAQWRQVADQVRTKLPKLAALLDEAEEDVLAYMSFPKEHRAKIHSTNPLERVNGEIKRRTEVVGIFPNEAAITRLIGAILLEQNRPDEAGDRSLVREDADHLGAPLDLAVDALEWIGRVELGPVLLGEAHIGEHVLLGRVQQGGELGQLLPDLVGDLAPLRPGRRRHDPGRRRWR